MNLWSQMRRIIKIWPGGSPTRRTLRRVVPDAEEGWSKVTEKWEGEGAVYVTDEFDNQYFQESRGARWKLVVEYRLEGEEK